MIRVLLRNGKKDLVLPKMLTKLVKIGLVISLV